MKTSKNRKVFVENYESRIMCIQRNIEYRLTKELPKDWDEMSVNKQGIWINKNAIFVKDYIDEPHYDELTSEETVEIRWDKDSIWYINATKKNNLTEINYKNWGDQ